MYFSVQRVIFSKAGHALHLCLDKTKLELCVFRPRAFAPFLPLLQNELWVELRDLTEGNADLFYRHAALCLQKRFIENHLCRLKFTHGANQKVT